MPWLETSSMEEREQFIADERLGLYAILPRPRLNFLLYRDLRFCNPDHSARTTLAHRPLRPAGLWPARLARARAAT